MKKLIVKNDQEEKLIKRAFFMLLSSDTATGLEEAILYEICGRLITTEKEEESKVLDPIHENRMKEIYEHR